MSAESLRVTPRIVLLMLAAFALTVALVLWMVRVMERLGGESRTAPVQPRQVSSENHAQSLGTATGARRDGVIARITSLTEGGERSHAIERNLPTMAFALQPGESLDSRVAPGAFRADFRVPFSTALSREAHLGVEFVGGKVMIMRRGEVILSDATGQQQRIAMTTLPVRLLVDQDEIQITFESDGRQPSRLRALWRPVDSTVPLPLPAFTLPMMHDEAMRGMALVQQFNCVSCHASSDAVLQTMLTANVGPILGDVGARLQPEWMRAWLRDPRAIKSGALMPHMALDEQQIEDVVHYLASLGGPADPLPARPPNSDLATTGMVAYHTVGCFACHGPLESIDALPGGHPVSSLRMLRTYESLGQPARKFTAKVLSSFLRDPVSHWPSGRMPSQNLTTMEADAIAAYLIARDWASRPDDSSDGKWSPDPQRIERGRVAFVSTGCANCHSLGPNRPDTPSTLHARTLESLESAMNAGSHGCAAGERSGVTPHFGISPGQRSLIHAFLRSLSSRRTANVPLDHLALAFSRLNCVACHTYYGERGPEAAIGQYFTAIEEADLGDEGRLPPNLSDVGAKLNPHWINAVLAERGIARPYLGARMPQFGPHNVDRFADLFAAASGVWSEPDHGPNVPTTYAEHGRQLVGAKAMNCIQCHNVAGKPSTGTPGPDLAHMAERLRYEAFARWIHDPKLTRPGTRMPSFFVGGRSAFTDILDGEAHKQVDAIWAYLSQGEFMPMPDGLVDPSSLTLQVIDEPVIFRSFIKGAGVRAIAVGYPEQIHLAFDAERCMVVAAWEGEFINAAGAWANRGGTETNPRQFAWNAPQDDMFVSMAMPGEPAARFVNRFRGYRLDDRRRPVFMYDLKAGDIELRVEDQPVPVREQGKARIIQRLTASGPPGAKVIIDLGNRRIHGTDVSTGVGVTSITLDEQGRGYIELELTW